MAGACFVAQPVPGDAEQEEALLHLPMRVLLELHRPRDGEAQGREGAGPRDREAARVPAGRVAAGALLENVPGGGLVEFLAGADLQRVRRRG